MAHGLLGSVEDVGKEEFSKVLVDLESRLARSTKELVDAEFRSVLQVSVVRELLAGERTMAELVEAIYGLAPGHDGYHTHYTRVRREIQRLASRGFVSRRLFGRNRPYRLTQLAVAKITHMASVRPSWAMKVLPGRDLVLFVVALAMAGVCALAGTGTIIELHGYPFLLLLVLSAFCGGMAFVRFAEILRRVT